MSSGDIPGDISTQAVLNVGESVTSTFELEFGDTDFFRVELSVGQTYEFYISDEYDDPNSYFSSCHIELYDSLGRRISNQLKYDYYFIASTLQISPTYSGVFYVGARNGPTLDGTPYTLSLQTVNSEYIEGLRATNSYYFRQLKLESGYGRNDTLETLGDRDRYQVTMLSGRRYRIQVLGSDTDSGTLLDPDMTLFMDGQILKDYNSGYGHNSELTVTASSSGNFDLIIRGHQGTGTYHVISTEIDDYRDNYTTDRWLPGLAGELTGTVGGPNDVDWFRVHMQAGRWYDFQIDTPVYRGLENPVLLLRNPNGELVEAGFPLSYESHEAGFSYFAQTSGTHYLIARSSHSGDSGDYRLSWSQQKRQLNRGYQTAEAEALGIPDFETSTDYIPFVNTGFAAPISLTKFVGEPLDGLFAYEVITDNKLVRLGVEQLVGQRYVIPVDDLQNWNLHMRPGTHSMQIRGLLDVDGQTSRTQWMFTTTTNRSWRDSIGFADVDSGQYWDHPITVGRPGSLPSYYAGQYSNFQAIPDNTILAQRFSDAWQDWLVVDHEVTGGGESADINIFIADGVTGYFDAYLPGDGIGGDIILNSAYYSPDSFLTTTSYHELQSALARALGLEGENGVEWQMSIAERLYPEYEVQTPTSADLTWIERLYVDTLDRPLGSLEAPVFTPETAGEFYTYRNNLSDINVYDTLDFSGASPDSYLHDLMLNGISSFEQGGEEVTLFRGLNVYYRNLIGTSGHDYLTGNSLDNVIRGGWGYDFLDGGEGNDLLIGSSGYDKYVFNYKSGHDRILEYEGAKEFSGRDTILYFHDEAMSNGRESLESLFVFQRRGDDLVVNLTLDSEGAEASITIEKMSEFNFQVESLNFVDHGIFSLVSVFSQLADGQMQRFKLDPNSGAGDSFGQLVIPAY